MGRFAATLLFGGLLLVGPASVCGQASPQFGLTFGVNRATMQTPSADLGGRFTFAGGLALRQPVFGPVALQSELLLNQKGAEVEDESGGGIEYGAVYLDLPLLVHVTTPSVGAVTVYGEAGGFGGVKLFERQTPGTGDLNLPLRAGTSFFRRFDTGILVGVGATIPVRGQRFNLVLRRAWGLVDVARDVGTQPFPDAAFPSRGETRTWSLLLRLGL